MARGSLAQGLAIGVTETDVYQTPLQLVKTLIQKAQFINSDGAGVATIDVWITPDSGTSTSEAIKVIDSVQIGVGETMVAIELIGEYVNTGGKIIAISDIAGVSAWINGNTFKTEV